MTEPNFRTSVVHLDRPGDPSVFDDQTRAEAAQIIARYPDGQARSALLPMLHLVQSVQGQVTPDGIAFCADQLDLTKAQVAAVPCRLMNEGSRRCTRNGRVPPALTMCAPSSPRGDSTAW